MKRWLASILCLAMLAPTLAEAAPAVPAQTMVQQGGHEPAYIVLTPEQVAATGSLLAETYAYPMPMGMEMPRQALGGQAEGIRVLGVPPLIWGLVLSIPGVIVVRLKSDERAATQRALLGAGINLAILTVVYFVVISPVTKGTN